MSIERIEQHKQVGDFEITIARTKNIKIQKIYTYDVMLSKMLKAVVAFVEAMLLKEDEK